MPPFLFVLIGWIGLTQIRRRPGLATVVTGTALFAILACSTNWVGTSLIQRLESSCPTIDSLKGKADAVVVLGGGVRVQAPEYGNQPELNATELERLRHGARIHRATSRPILVTGGSPDGAKPESLLMRSVLREDFGVETRWVEVESRTTRENARNSARILKAEGVRRIYLVSQAWHLARAVRAFEAEGLTVVPAGTGCRVLGDFRLIHLVPHPNAIEMSYWAVHEWVGGMWYRLIHPKREGV